MTLGPIGVVSPTPTPASQAAAFRNAGFDTAHDRFLDTEEAALRRLIAFYEQARSELTSFLERGQTTASDREFYAELERQAGDTLEKVGAGSASWMADTLPAAYVAGANLGNGGDFAFRPVHDQALRALSGYSLGLIVDTNEGIRRSIQQAIASGISSGLSRDEVISRIIDSGLQPGPWSSIAIRAGVVARTETMRAYNAGNVAGIRETGAVAVEWHAARDERTCEICAPLDGKAFVLPDVSDEEARAAGVPDEWPSLQPIGTKGNVLKVPPRHPRCRCTVRARYRHDDGSMLGSKPPDDEAMLEEAKTAGAPPTDFEARLAELGTGDPYRQAALAKQSELDADLAAAQVTQGGLLSRLYDVPNAFGNRLGPAALNYTSDAKIFDLIRAHDAQLLDDLIAARKRLAEIIEMKRAVPGQSFDPERMAYWRSIDLDQATLERIASVSGRARAMTMTNFMRYRYGVELDWRAGYTPDMMKGILRGFETVKAGWAGYVTDSPALRVMQTGRLGPNVLGDYLWTESRLRLSLGRLPDYLEPGSLRSGIAPGLDEIVVHEIAHSIESYLKKQPGGGVTADWEDLRARNNPDRKVAPDQSPAAIARLRQTIIDWEKSLAERAALNREASTNYASATLDRLKRELEEATSTAPKPGVEYLPTEYAKRGGAGEDFAESVMLFLLNPEKLRLWSPARYDFIQSRVFKGKEPPERWHY